MSITEDLISYWRDSLLDAERMGLSGQVFNDTGTYFRISRAEVASGRINQVTTWQLFNSTRDKGEEETNVEQQQIVQRQEEFPSNLDTEDTTIDNHEEELVEGEKPSGNEEKKDDEEPPINLLICPVLSVQRNSPDRKESVAPQWIPAQLTPDGRLLPDSENSPWLSRKLLEPTESRLTIGTLEAFNVFLTLEDKAAQCWDDYWHYCNRMLKEDTGMNYNDFILEDYVTLPETFVLLNTSVQGSSRHILTVYEWLLKGLLASTRLLQRYASVTDNTLLPLLTQRHLSKISIVHLGQMTDKYPLSVSQREALYHFFTTSSGEMLAVNGPPGTGKTTLLQSVVASLWVRAAFLKEEPPIIVATSTNNQAVTNIIDSFGKLKPDSESPLAGRWLPGIKSYGLYLPSKGRKSNFQTVDSQGFGFPATMENKKYVTHAEGYFLERCSTFAERRIVILKQAVEFLHQQLLVVIKELLSSVKSKSFNLQTQGTLDRTARYEAFELATHYWEGRWLMEMQHAFRTKPDTNFPREEDLQYRFRRYAKLTPCFVSTFYMTPKFFSVYVDDGPYPLIESIDLLIVDEAGQSTPEVAGATFALAKQALVVGDTLQIEPVWSIPGAVDVGNLQKHCLISKTADKDKIDTQKEIFDELGLSASAGSVMKIAQRASCYQKYEEQRGMFLTEHRRCAEEIIGYCNELCYRGKLKPMRDMIDSPSYSPFPYMGYLHISGKARRIASSRQNEVEAKKIAQWLDQQYEFLEESYEKPLEEIVGIVTPFSKQAELIQKELNKFKIFSLTVGTVHRLQGAERNIIIFSSVYDSQNRGTFFFDRNVNILNVAVSRARDSFLVFGDRNIFNLSSKGTPSNILADYLFKNNSNQLKNTLIEQFELSNFDSKVYLNVPFSQKDDAKKLGARWDPQNRRWYVQSGSPLDAFAKWLPKDDEG